MSLKIFHLSLCLLLLLILATESLLVKADDGKATKASDSRASSVGGGGFKEGDDDEVTIQQHRDAFLGKDEAPEFNKLSPEEAKRRLKELLHRIDTNRDSSISLAEMVNWLRTVAQKDRLAMSRARFRVLKAASEAKHPEAPLTFEELQLAMQRELQTEQSDAAATAKEGNTTAEAAPPEKLLAGLMERSRLRWSLADADGDGRLSPEELADFLRPEESPRMRRALVQEALAAGDANRDGRLDMGEHLRDLYPEYERDRREGRQMPAWVAKEEAHFREYLDLDSDGSLNEDEIYKLVVPESADHAKTEANHLFSEADANGDKFLSLEEALNKWHAFVGHGATNYGAFNHEEL